MHRLAPNGRSLIIFKKSSPANANLCQHGFATPETFVIAEGLDLTGDFGTEFSPLAPGWSGMYVSFLVDISMRRTPSVVLVDASRHEIVDTWTRRDLGIETVNGDFNWPAARWYGRGMADKLLSSREDLILIF